MTDAGGALELGDRERFADRQDVEEVVGDAAPLGGGGLRRTDVHAAVDRHRVGVDDLAPEALGQVEGEAGLAGGRGPDDGHDRQHLHVVSVATERPDGYGPPDEGSAMGFLDKLKKQATKAVDQHGDKVAEGHRQGRRHRRQEDQGQVHRQDRDRPGQGQGRARQARRQERRRPRAAAAWVTACLTSSRRSPRARPIRADRAEPTRRTAGRAAADRPARRHADARRGIDRRRCRTEGGAEAGTGGASRAARTTSPSRPRPEPGQGEAAREAQEENAETSLDQPSQ